MRPQRDVLAGRGASEEEEEEREEETLFVNGIVTVGAANGRQRASGHRRRSGHR